nr:zinc knuckle CX2CX4HX4C [Tanacetum cinerariifolium]
MSRLKEVEAGMKPAMTIRKPIREVEAGMKPAMTIRKPIRGIKNPNYKEEHAYVEGDQIGVSSNTGQMSKKSQDETTVGTVSSWLINETSVETLFGVNFTSLSDIDDFSMSIKEGKKKFQDEVNKAGGTQLSSSPKVSTSSLLVSPSTTIIVPRELNSIDVAATFGVPLTIVGDLHNLINVIEAGEHEELLYGMTNDDRMETLDALGSIRNSIRDDCNNLPSKDSPSDPIVQTVDINTKSTSYAGAAGASTMARPQVNFNFRPLVADPVFNGVNISIPRKVVEKDSWSGSGFARCLIEVNSEVDLVDSVTISIPSLTEDDFTKETIRVEYEWRPHRCDECRIFGHVHDHCPKKMVSPSIVTTSNVVAPTIEKSNDGFQTVGKKKKRKVNMSLTGSYSLTLAAVGTILA